MNNSLVGLVIVRYSFCIFNLVSSLKILVDLSQRNHNSRQSDGKEYVYVVFWTSIANERDSDLELSIDFPVESFTIPSSLNVNFNLYLPNEEMLLEKEHLFNYGLDLKSFLDENIEKPSELVKTVASNESYSFYVIAISNRGVNGVVRAGFELEKQNLIYKINNHEINSGQIRTKK